MIQARLLRTFNQNTCWIPVALVECPEFLFHTAQEVVLTNFVR